MKKDPKTGEMIPKLVSSDKVTAITAGTGQVYWE